MGLDVEVQAFHKNDYDLFLQRLTDETTVLRQLFEQHSFVKPNPNTFGAEIECCLVDNNLNLSMRNQALLEKLDPSLNSPELAKFNFELNTPPYPFNSKGLSDFTRDIKKHFLISQNVAKGLGNQVVATGVLPIINTEDLVQDNMTPLGRYKLLSQQLLRTRYGRPINVKIDGSPDYEFIHEGVMLESAATSLQIHWQLDPSKAEHTFNSALASCGYVLAPCCNSPIFNNKKLWSETRIKIFEQSIQLRADEHQRVYFPSQYVKKSVMECFDSNVSDHQILLPVDLSDSQSILPHLGLHNGTIWRWIRPIIGGSLAQPTLRFEHRILPAGPTLTDIKINMLYTIGLVEGLCSVVDSFEERLPIEKAKQNFYRAARYGIDANLTWIDKKQYTFKKLVSDKILPVVQTGLNKMKIEQSEIDMCLEAIEKRTLLSRTGAHWQVAVYDKYDKDARKMLADYIDNQNSNNPVHTWKI